MEKQEIEKIKNQIEKAQKYLLSFSGHATKTYAVKQRIFKLKDKIGDTSPTYVLGPYGPYVSRQESKMDINSKVIELANKYFEAKTGEEKKELNNQLVEFIGDNREEFMCFLVRYRWIFQNSNSIVKGEQHEGSYREMGKKWES